MARDLPFDSLAGHRYAVLVTFRRSGEAVPSPVWFALDGGRAYVKTASEVGKVKRIRLDARVLLAPSTMRGRPTAEPIRGRARLLDPEEWPAAEARLAAAYGAGRNVADRFAAGDGVAYIEIVPRGT